MTKQNAITKTTVNNFEYAYKIKRGYTDWVIIYWKYNIINNIIFNRITVIVTDRNNAVFLLVQTVLQSVYRHSIQENS